MKIAVVNQHVDDKIGGSELQCDLLASHLQARGHQIVYLALHAQSRTVYRRSYRVVKGPRTSRTLRSVPAETIKRLLKDEEPDIVYWRFNTKSLLRAARICRKVDTKLILGTSNPKDVRRWLRLRTETSGLKRIYHYLLNIRESVYHRLNYEGYRWIDGVVLLRHTLEPHLPKLPDHAKVTTVYDSIAADVVNPFSWPRPYIVWVSNLKRIKNPELLVEAVRRMGRDDIDVLMIGGMQNKAYEYIRDPDNRPPNLHYLGPKPIEEVDAIIAGSLFLVHTTNPEGFGNNLIQAWMQGKPTVVLYFDPDNLITDNEIGLCSGSMEQFCSDINWLIDNSDIRAEMGERAVVLARDMFGIEQNASKVELFFEDIVSAVKAR